VSIKVRRLALVLLSIAAGCATQHPSQAAKQAAEMQRRMDKQAAAQLYAGEPAVVHSTQDPVTSADEGIRRGDEAYRAGQVDLAVYLYVESLSLDSTRAEPFMKIGAIHEQKGNTELAAKAFELALERQPDNPAVCERLGLLYLQSGRDSEAPTLFERAVAADPRRWRSWNGLGILADRSGDFAAAIADYDKALAIEPDAAMVMNNRGYSRYLAGDLTGAEADLKSAIRLGAKGNVWRNLGKVQALQGRYAEGLETLTSDTDLAHAYNLLGEAAMERGDFESAKRYFQSAISEAPRFFEEAQKNLALANERLLAAPANSATKVVLADTPVYSDGAVVGLVSQGDVVQVLRTQQTSSLVRFRNSNGAEHTGWMPSASLAERPKGAP
jgi:Flp pilus assembly protein TadD